MFQKGRKKTGGRQKGTPDKADKALKDVILAALALAGGERYLYRVAKKQPAVFCALVGRVLPLQMKASNDEPLMPRRVIIELEDIVPEAE